MRVELIACISNTSKFFYNKNVKKSYNERRLKYFKNLYEFLKMIGLLL